LSASVFAFPSPSSRGPQPWTNVELAELYRVVDILGRAGLAVETDMGMSEEGDPWFVFCRIDTMDVIAHFARIDGQFVAASIAVDETYRGANFRQIVDRMVQSQPLILPPPGRGTRLLLHPSVILTAFVATALAHSEKAHADAFRAVEAKWDHHHQTETGAARHVKGAWFDSLPAMLRGSGEARAGADMGAAGNNQAITLASLIAIAVAAMQPVVEKLSAVTSAVLDGLHSAEASVHNTVAHVFAAAVADLPVIAGALVKSDDSIIVKSEAATTASDQPSHKAAAVDYTADAMKIIIADMSSSTSSPLQKSIVLTDDVAHTPAQPVVAAALEAQQDAAFMAMLTAQKTAAEAVSPASHTDATVSSAPIMISLDDVSQQALQVLNIRLDSATSDHAKSTDSSVAAGGSTSTSQISGAASTSSLSSGHETSTSSSATVPTTAPATQEMAITTTNGSEVIAAIANFAASTSHEIAGGITASSTLLTALAPYTSAGQSLKVIVFESNSLSSDIFSFTTGIVFVDEKYVSSHTLANPGGNLVLDLATGGSVTLVGIATIGHTALT